MRIKISIFDFCDDSDEMITAAIIEARRTLQERITGTADLDFAGYVYDIEELQVFHVWFDVNPTGLMKYTHENEKKYYMNQNEINLTEYIFWSSLNATE